MKKLIYFLVICNILITNVFANDIDASSVLHDRNDSTLSTIPINLNTLSFYFSLNETLSGDSYAFGSLINIEKDELSNLGLNYELNYEIYKFGISYDRILTNCGTNYLAFKGDIGYSFIIQSYAYENHTHENRSLLIKYPYCLFGPEFIIPLGKIKNAVAIATYYQIGIIQYGKYMPLSSISDNSINTANSTSLNGIINNFGISLNLYSEIISSKIFLDFTNYNYSFDNLNYQYKGHVSKAYINEFCFGFAFGVSF